MDSIAARESEAGDIGVIASFTWRPNARGGIPLMGDKSPPSQSRGTARKPSSSAIFLETPVAAVMAERVDGGTADPSMETQSECEQSSSTTLDVGGLALVSDEDSVVALDTGAAANLVCLRWLEHHNRLLEKKGRQKVATFPSSARSRFGATALAMYATQRISP